jgi:VanZ family protein
MCLIFCFSNQNGEESGSISQIVSEKIINIFCSKKTPTEKKILSKNIEGYIRKLAHFSIYATLGLLLCALLCTYNLTQKQIIIACLGFGIIYATSDEIHQTFINQRSGNIIDVWIDNLGVMTGTYFILIIAEIRRLKYEFISIV